MMRLALLVVAVGVAAAAPQFNQQRFEREFIPILVDEKNGPDDFGNFGFRYETGDGIIHEANGQPVGDESYFVQGSYSYTSPEGNLIQVTYSGDENGYQAQTSGLPEGPAWPAHALAQVRAAEEAFARQRADIAAGRSFVQTQPQPQRQNFRRNQNRRPNNRRSFQG